MKSDRIALIAGIASLGLVSTTLPQRQAQNIGGLTPVPAAPIVVKASDPPASKMGTVLLLSGQ